MLSAVVVFCPAQYVPLPLSNAVGLELTVTVADPVRSAAIDVQLASVKVDIV